MPPSTKKRSGSATPAKSLAAAAPKASPSPSLLNKSGLPTLDIPSDAGVSAPAYSPSHSYLSGQKDSRRHYLPPTAITLVLAVHLLVTLYELVNVHGYSFLTAMAGVNRVVVLGTALYLFFTYSLESASSAVVGLLLQLCLLDLGSVQASVPVLLATPTNVCALYTVATQGAFALGAAVLANRLAFANGQTNKSQ